MPCPAYLSDEDNLYRNLFLIPTPCYLGHLTPGIAGSKLYIKYKHKYAVDLSQEYTDAMALANAAVVNSNSLTAENLPRTNSFQSRWTTVTYNVNLSNLVFGETYTVMVDLETSAHVTTTRTYHFEAAGTTHVITDTIPTPAAGTRITVKNQRIAYST